MEKPFSSQKKGILIGFFLSLGFTIILISFLVSGANFSIFDSRFTLLTELDQAQGIGSGSQVALNGMTIGNVERVEISPESIHHVRVIMKLDKKFTQRIPSDSFVELKTQGALGDKYLQIRPGTSPEMLKSGDHIKSMHSKDLLDIISEKGADAQNLFQLITEAASFIKNINQQDKIMSIIENTEQTSREMRKLSQDLRLTLHSMNENERKYIQETLKGFVKIAEKIDKGQGTLGALINDPSIYHQLKKILVKTDDKSIVESLFLKNMSSTLPPER